MDPTETSAIESDSYMSAPELQLALRMEKLGLSPKFSDMNKSLAKLMNGNERLSNAEVSKAVKECLNTWPEFEEQGHKAMLDEIMPHVAETVVTDSATIQITHTNVFGFINILVIITKAKATETFTSQDWRHHINKVYKVTCLIMGIGIEGDEPELNPWDQLSAESLSFLKIMALSIMEYVEEGEKFASMVDFFSAKVSTLRDSNNQLDKLELRVRAAMLVKATRRHRVQMSTVIDQMQSDLITEVTRQNYPEALADANSGPEGV